MSPRITSVAEALELYMPPFVDPVERWSAVAVHSPAPRRRLSRRRIAAAAAAVAVAATLVATPAFGIRGLISDLVGRIDVSFSSGHPAPVEIKRDFYDLDLGVPSSMAQHALAGEARHVTTFTVNGKRHVLWVAPTRDGGYCWQLSGAFGGCRAHAKERAATPLGVTFSVRDSRGVESVASAGGDITAPTAHSLAIVYADGTQSAVPFYYVSKPIDAGFFFAVIPAGHDTVRTRPIAAVLRDTAGRMLGRQAFVYQTRAQVARQRAQTQAMLRQMRGHHRAPRYGSPKLPPPTAPFQTGSAGGVSVVAGSNGVVVFDTRGATSAVKRLIAGGAVGYGCFKRLPYGQGPVAVTFPRTFAPRVAIRLQGTMGPPFLGCEIEGTYGHRWPDRNGSHSAVEIAFTPVMKTYFVDRAAARDLALFIRSRTMHRLRRLSGGALRTALQRTYGMRILATSRPPQGRIGYVTSGGSATFVEISPTGKRFYIRFAGGRLHGQNLKPYAFPF